MKSAPDKMPVSPRDGLIHLALILTITDFNRF